MSIREKLRSAAVKVVRDPQPAPENVPECRDLFAAIYGSNPIPEKARQGTVVTILSDADVDRHLSGELTDARRAGLAAEIQLRGLDD